MSDAARALLRWIERCGGSTPHEAILVEFLDRRPGYGPDDVKDALAELEEVGAVRWANGETVELVP